LDLLTIKQEFGKFKGLKVLVVGDIKHSRVAHSNIEVMRRLGMDVMISAPKEFQDHEYEYTDFDKAVKSADVINLLRIQNERLTEKMKISINAYNTQYGLNAQRVKLMKPNAIIIHPAPFNRNVEINDDIVECKQARIFKQMENGVYVRMAVIARALK
jgi:aspartate carbamoyltransferase catalytic subunit